ncbi:hypothetical protein QL285_036440 [Trifolium repens]|nr:hypothetical protein QL285_036440 [Trifolium repens]
MERFVATQTLVNEDIRKQHLHNNETLRQLNIVVESLATSNKALETQISLLAQTPLGPFPQRHTDVVTTNSERQIENPKKSDNEKIVENEKNPPTPPETEVVKEVEKEEPYIIPPPYNLPISFSQRFVEAEVDSQSKRYVEVLENIHTNALLSEVLHKKRKLEDRETKEIISVKKGRVDFEVVDEGTEPKPKKLILMIEPEPPPHVQNSEPPYRRKKRKGEGYGRWLDKWPWKPKFIKSFIRKSFLEEPP